MQAHIGELERALSQGKNGAQQQVVQLQQQLAQTEQQLAESRQQLEQAPSAPSPRRRQRGAGCGRRPPQRPSAARTWSTTPRPSRCWPWPSRPPTSTWRSPRPRPSGCSPRRRAELREPRSTAAQAAGPASTSTRPRAGRASSTRRAPPAPRAPCQDAEQRAATITAQFEQRKAALERRVEELRTFEREYRTRLKSYLESQLRDLDASGNAEPAQNDDMAEAQQS